MIKVWTFGGGFVIYDQILFLSQHQCLRISVTDFMYWKWNITDTFVFYSQSFLSKWNWSKMGVFNIDFCPEKIFILLFVVKIYFKGSDIEKLSFRSRLSAQIEKIPPQDSFHASKQVCHLLRSGVAGLFGPESGGLNSFMPLYYYHPMGGIWRS